MPNKHEAAPEANRGSGNVLAFDGGEHPLNSQYRPGVQAALFTAVPIGRAWTVKAIAPDGEELRLGRFEDRLHALGAAVLLASQAEGRVSPMTEPPNSFSPKSTSCSIGATCLRPAWTARNAFLRRTGSALKFKTP